MDQKVLANLRSPVTWIALLSLLFVASIVTLVFDLSLALPLIAAGIVLVALLLFENPLILLSVLIVIRMSLDYSSQYFGITIFETYLSLSQLMGIGIALLGAAAMLLGRERVRSFPLLVPFLIIAIWGVLSLVSTISLRTSLTELIRFFDLFVIGFIAYVSVKNLDDFKKLLMAIFASSLLPIVFGLYQFTLGIGLEDENVSIPRIFGTFSHPNVFSLYLMSLFALATTWLLALERTRQERIYLLSYLALVFGMLLLTYARIAWITLFLFTFLVALWRYRLALIPLFVLPFFLFLLSNIASKICNV